ncbi:MAG: 30S ribosomal protein S9 [Elusimicrobiota bacterium]|jgi:small subunit ribosomal protein S9|nr:30S ribosomal protein S9 [Elusimicrobiota bacterium]
MKGFYWGLGRRKTSVARVKLATGKGKINVNNLTVNDYFKGSARFIEEIKSPLNVTKTLSKFDIKANVVGGGITGQSGAIKLGIARALSNIDVSNHTILRNAGMLTRDSRMVERKKPGKPKARKSFQFSKR